MTRTVREGALRRKFGLTSGQYDTLLSIQLGACALCRRPPKTVRLNVDHDHRTGVIRGLLCHRCNRGLGYFSDPEVLRRAADYLRNANTGYQVPRRKRKRRGKGHRNPGADETTAGIYALRALRVYPMAEE